MAVKKKAAAKTAPKKAAAKAQPAPAAAKKATTAVSEAFTKTQLLNALVEGTGLPKKDVVAVMDELGSIIERHVKKRAVGTFTLPGLLKIKRVKKPATKKRMGRNPATGEPMEISAKPAKTVVKVLALKALKEMAG